MEEFELKWLIFYNRPQWRVTCKTYRGAPITCTVAPPCVKILVRISTAVLCIWCTHPLLLKVWVWWLLSYLNRYILPKVYPFSINRHRLPDNKLEPYSDLKHVKEWSPQFESGLDQIQHDKVVVLGWHSLVPVGACGPLAGSTLECFPVPASHELIYWEKMYTFSGWITPLG